MRPSTSGLPCRNVAEAFTSALAVPSVTNPIALPSETRGEGPASTCPAACRFT